MNESHDKFVNDRSPAWTAKSAASQQRGPLQKRYTQKMKEA